MIVWGGLTNSWKRREVKGKGEKERYTHLNTEFQKTARIYKKAFLSEQWKKKIEENNRMGKTRDLFKKIEDTKGTFHAKKSMKVKVTQLCPTLWDPMNYTVHGILQARILEWVVFPFSRASTQPWDWTQVSRIAGEFINSWTTREAHFLKRWAK